MIDTFILRPTEDILLLMLWDAMGFNVFQPKNVLDFVIHVNPLTLGLEGITY